MGPEFVHGANSKFTRVVEPWGLGFTEKPWPDFWYFGREQRLTDNNGVAKEVEQVRQGCFPGVGVGL